MTPAPIHPLRRIRFELGDWSAEKFAQALGTHKLSILTFEKTNNGSWKLVQLLSERLCLSLDDASALCRGTIGEEALKLAVEKAKAALQTSAQPTPVKGGGA